MTKSEQLRGLVAATHGDQTAKIHPLAARLELAAWFIANADHFAQLEAENERLRGGWNAGVEAAAKTLEDDAQLCDCSAHSEGECACGAWCEWKSITSARAVEIVRNLTQGENL